MSLRALALAVLVLVAGAAQAAEQAAPTARRVVDEAAQAMGGRERILAAKSLVMEGLGENPNLLQQMRPEDEPLVWMLPTWRMAIDLEHGRSAVQLVRRPAFPAVFDNWAQDARLDGDVAWDAGAPFGGAAPPPRRAGADQVRERRLAMLRHPLTALRAALDPRSRLGSPRREGGEVRLDLTTAAGDRLTLGFDPLTHLPASVATTSENVLLGDVVTTTRFTGWEVVQPAGLWLPRRLTATTDRWVEYDIGVMTNAVGADVGFLAAPEAVRAAAPPDPTAQPLTVAPAAKGIWMITGAGGWASVLIEFSDHLALIDAPIGEARALAIFAKARELVPGKPLTQLIVSHFHADHAGGVRTAIAEGLTLVTQRGNSAFFREAARRPFTIEPDLLARRPRPLKLVDFDESLTLKDATMEVQLIHVRHSPHGETLLMAWFPKDRILAQADLWLPGSRITPHAVAFAAELERLKLPVERQIPLHGGQIKTQAEFLTVVQALRAGTMK
jgi:glyoxylase-like metal-dependent hydrolase (beta-lactamase superfamily II)